MIIVKKQNGACKPANRNSDRDNVLAVWRLHVLYVVFFVFFEFVDT